MTLASARRGPHIACRRLCYRQRPVGSILDVAVIAVAILVSITLGLLAWTLGVSTTRALRRLRRDLLLARLQLATAERRLRGGPPPADELAPEPTTYAGDE
jgi:type II secretory pathway pseudopilin PulG